MCPKAKQGMSICSEGPVVWCASLENAKMCNVSIFFSLFAHSFFFCLTLVCIQVQTDQYQSYLENSF